MKTNTTASMHLTNTMKSIIFLASAVAGSEANGLLRGTITTTSTIDDDNGNDKTAAIFVRHRDLQQHSNKAGLMIMFVVIVILMTTLHLYASYYNSLPKISDGNTVRSETSDDNSSDDEDEEVPSNPASCEETE